MAGSVLGCYMLSGDLWDESSMKEEVLLGRGLFNGWQSSQKFILEHSYTKVTWQTGHSETKLLHAKTIQRLRIRSH